MEKLITSTVLDSNNPQCSIRNVCSRCGIAANVTTCLRKYGRPPKKLCFDVSTFHKAECDWCGEWDSVTEVRDFFYPDFKFLFQARAAFNRKTDRLSAV